MQNEVIGKHRLEATQSILRRIVTSESNVVEVGSNDASFRNDFSARSWTTVDKFGEPDIRIDINDPQVRLPFDDESCDVVICTEVLEHLTMGGPFVREMARVLKPTGAAVISVPNIASLKSRFKVLLGGLPNMAASGDCGPPLGGSGVLSEDGNWVAGHVVDFNRSRLRGYLQRAGFRSFTWHVVPVRFSLAGFNFALPQWLLSASVSDFLLIEARAEEA
ncbi:methyltransferase domain-containing protein [Luteimonas sp. A649]